MTTYYRIEDFLKILFNGFDVKVASDVEQTLKFLESNITPTEDLRSAGAATGAGAGTIRRKPKQIIGASRVDDWNTVRTAKSVAAAKPEVKEGPEKTIKDIRIALNKFTIKNADTQKDAIVQLIRLLGAEETNKITDMIFDIVSSNGFYSELYVNLYKHLISEFAFFADKLPDILGKYKNSFNNIVPVDPNVDYDAYCAYTKQNDLRKSMTMFIVNLVKQGVLQSNDILDLILHLEELVLNTATDAAQSNSIEEIIDNIYIIVTESKPLLKSSKPWTDVLLPNIKRISQLRKLDAAKYVGMSNRASFKVMDIIDNVK